VSFSSAIQIKIISKIRIEDQKNNRTIVQKTDIKSMIGLLRQEHDFFFQSFDLRRQGVDLHHLGV
jgi:hypothetical protein